jgi:methylglutaconyl-CoA hydratase
MDRHPGVGVSLIDLAVRNGVATVTLIDEEHRNVLSRSLVDELTETLDAIKVDPGVRVVVVTNRGRTFCAGADLTEASSTAGPRVDLGALFTRIQRSDKPFVGRLAGHCVAGGVGLAAVMDISVALDTATFGFTEVRLGLAPAVISVVCLPKMRRADALEFFLRGNRFTAIEAADMGLINAVASAEDLDATVNAIVADLLLGQPDALGAAKRLVYDVPELDHDAAFAWTTELSARLFASDPAREGMAAYLEKRKPSWATSTGDDGT